VQDDLTFTTIADDHELISECNDRAFQAIVPKHLCASSQDTIAPVVAWNVGSSTLELVADPGRCSCWWFDL